MSSQAISTSQKRLTKLLNQLAVTNPDTACVSKQNTDSGKKYRILITGVYYPLAPRIYKQLQSLGHDVVLLKEPLNYADAKRELLRHLKEDRNDYDAIMNAWTLTLESSVLRQLPNLKIVSCISSGTNNVDTKYCKENNIKVTNVPSALSETVADMVVGMILATCRNIVHSSNILRVQGKNLLNYPKYSNSLAFAWKTKDLHKSTVGLVGLGGIGKEVSKRLKFGFGSNVIYYEPFGRMMYDTSVGAKYVKNFEELIKQSDIVVPLCPLLDSTKGMFNKKVFGLMKKNAIFVNVARGGLVNTDDLVNALKNGDILQAGLDVTDPEPLPIDHELFKLDNVTITPHIGSATEECRNRMLDYATKNLLDFLKTL